MFASSVSRLVSTVINVFFFFFSSRRRHTRCSRDWSSDVCSSDLAIACHLLPGPLVSVFSKDEGVIAVGTEYLRIISFNYVASGLVFVASSTFQAMGNTIPSLIASVVRIALVAIPGVIISRLPGFELRWLWWLSVASVFVQLVLAILLLRREFGLRLAWSSP